MKTSNKILIGFFAVVFLIPLMTVMSFKRKIGKGQFKIESQEGQGSNFRSGEFAAYKVVRFVSPENRLLKVSLKESDSLYYSYHMIGPNDSIRVNNVGDTLLITYVEGAKNPYQDRPELQLNLKLPSLANLIIDNAEVTLDSLNNQAPRSINASINNMGSLNIGTIFRPRIHENGTDEIDFPYALQQLSVDMNEGELSLGQKVSLQQLTLNAGGRSIITIREGATIGEASGKLSGESSVKANWKYVKQLAALATE